MECCELYERLMVLLLLLLLYFQIRLYAKGHSNGRASYSHRTYIIWLEYGLLAIYGCWLLLRLTFVHVPLTFGFIGVFVWHHVVIDMVFALDFIASIWINVCDFISICFASVHSTFSFGFLSLFITFTCAKKSTFKWAVNDEQREIHTRRFVHCRKNNLYFLNVHCKCVFFVISNEFPNISYILMDPKWTDGYSVQPSKNRFSNFECCFW